MSGHRLAAELRRNVGVRLGKVHLPSGYIRRQHRSSLLERLALECCPVLSCPVLSYAKPVPKKKAGAPTLVNAPVIPKFFSSKFSVRSCFPYSPSSRYMKSASVRSSISRCASSSSGDGGGGGGRSSFIGGLRPPNPRARSLAGTPQPRSAPAGRARWRAPRRPCYSPSSRYRKSASVRSSISRCASSSSETAAAARPVES